MSFIKGYAKHILPDKQRNPAFGDYYGSPLTQLGIAPTAASQVAIELMQAKPGPTTLEQMARKRDFFDPLYSKFKDKLSTIVLAETLLRVFPETAPTLNPDFFDGIDNYFGTSSNAHTAKESIYRHLLCACLAHIWLAFMVEKRSLPTESALDSRLVTLINGHNNQTLTADAVDVYCALYRYAYPKNLSAFLNQNLALFLSQCQQTKLKPASFFSLHGLPGHRPEKRKQRLFHDGSFAPYKLIFNCEPWSLFLHNYKDGNTLDYTKTGEPFPFYAKHPAPSLLWSSFLLIDLHEQLSQPVHGIASTMGTTAMNITELSGLSLNAADDLTVAADTEEPKPCRAVYRELQQQSTNRFALSPSGAKPSAIATPETPWLLDQLNDELTINQVAQDQACTIDLRIPEAIFENQPEPTVWTNIHVFLYNGDRRSTIPCLLTEEFSEMINTVETVCLQVELDRDCMNSLGFDPQKTPCLGGLACHEGKADIVVVFSQ